MRLLQGIKRSLYKDLKSRRILVRRSFFCWSCWRRHHWRLLSQGFGIIHRLTSSWLRPGVILNQRCSGSGQIRRWSSPSPTLSWGEDSPCSSTSGGKNWSFGGGEQVQYYCVCLYTKHMSQVNEDLKVFLGGENPSIFFSVWGERHHFHETRESRKEISDAIFPIRKLSLSRSLA